MFERFKSLPQVWRTGRLALRLVRDPRVPTAAKLLFGATVLYMLSPIDVVPDWLPVLGQADDLVVLMAGLNLFLRACPKWLVEEHEGVIDTSRDDRPPASTGPSRRSTIDADYQPVR
jgi:uncharacterized membrane protein YkvA (DUF1232 family)